LGNFSILGKGDSTGMRSRPENRLSLAVSDQGGGKRNVLISDDSAMRIVSIIIRNGQSYKKTPLNKGKTLQRTAERNQRVETKTRLKKKQMNAEKEERSGNPGQRPGRV